MTFWFWECLDCCLGLWVMVICLVLMLFLVFGFYLVALIVCCWLVCCLLFNIAGCCRVWIVVMVDLIILLVRWVFWGWYKTGFVLFAYCGWFSCLYVILVILAFVDYFVFVVVLVGLVLYCGLVLSLAYFGLFVLEFCALVLFSELWFMPPNSLFLFFSCLVFALLFVVMVFL